VRILVIDDHPAVALLVAEALENEGHQAFVAGSGEEGLQVIQQNPLDAVFLDIVMPGIDGIEVLRRIREKHANLPVIILSGRVTEGQIETARELGVTDVLRKPAPLKYFARALARVPRAGG
jgi:CheY-like chemotaxis protein